MTVKPHLAATILAAALVLSPASVTAQDVSASHEQAARAALEASGASAPFDNILLSLGARIKEQLISTRPDLVDQISAIVDEEMIKLAPRRGDLEREAARIYANTFTEEELKTITEFYRTTAGRKILSEGAIVGRELSKAARVWTAGVQRDLAQNSGAALQKITE